MCKETLGAPCSLEVAILNMPTVDRSSNCREQKKSATANERHHPVGKRATPIFCSSGYESKNPHTPVHVNE